MKTMLRAELLRPGALELREVPVPEPGEGELLLRVDAALTCGTDLKNYRRGHPKLPLPAPLGHEVSGTVAAAGAGTRFREGDALALAPTAPCGRCRLCVRGRGSLCPDAVGRMLTGAFAEYLLVPEHIVRRHVFPRPAGLAAEEAAALEPLACVVHGAARLDLRHAEHVVLIGDGAIALLFAQVALHDGAGAVTVAGRHEARLDVARELGADALRLEGEALREAVRERTAGVGADVVIECVGLPATWEAAPGLAAVGAEVLLFGGCAAGATATFDSYRVHYEELELKGAFHYGTPDVHRALDLLASGAVSVAPLITHRRPLEQVEEAIGLALDRTAIKVAVLP